MVNSKAAKKKTKSNNRVDRKFLCTIILEYFLMRRGEVHGDRVSVRTFYKENKHCFSGKFSKRTFDRK